MNDNLRKDYEEAKQFWNTAFTLNEEEKKEVESQAEKENVVEQLAPSGKLYHAVKSLGEKKTVLDYGCGKGWASLIAAKSGCTDVTAVDVAENAVETAKHYVQLYGVEDYVWIQHISEEWISNVPSESYDGIVCSNVLDVIPEEVAEHIIENFARIAKVDALVIIGMNYYMEPKDNPDKKMTVKNGNHVYVDGILRLVPRTDKAWIETFEKYFVLEKLEHFAWPGENEERRRLFYLRRKE